MTRRDVLYALLYSVCGSRAYEAVWSPDKSAVIMHGGGPLWLLSRGDTAGDAVRSFFISFIEQNGNLCITGLIGEYDAAVICAGAYAEARAAAFHIREYGAYYLPPEILCATGYKPGPASKDDAAFVSEWVSAFYKEAFMEDFMLAPAAEPEPAAGGLANQCLYILRDGGMPVSMGMLCGNRINLIYTPPGLRGRGYGRGITAALAVTARENGGLPVLYASPDNAAAVNMYRSLGFTGAGRLAEIIFDKG